MNTKKNAVGYIVLVIAWAILIYIFAYMFLPSLAAPSASISFSNYVGIFFILVILSFPSLFVSYAVLDQYSIKYSKNGITKKFLWINVQLDWEDIEEIFYQQFTLILKSKDRNFRIGLFFYQKPVELTYFIKTQVEKHLLDN